MERWKPTATHRTNKIQSGIGLLDWTRRYRPLLIPGRPFDIERHAYLVDIYNYTGHSMVIDKAGQMGASEYLIGYAFHAADQRDATVLYVFPTDTHVSDFSSARIGPAIEASEYLDSIVIEGSGDRRGADRVTLKRVRNRFIYLRGGKVDLDGRAAQLKAVDADVLILDEVDEMDPRAPAIAVKRLGHSLIAEERKVSTPTYAGMGIHAEWLESDQREWHVACGRCGEWQPLTVDQVVTGWDALGRPVAWHGQDEVRAWAACRKCGREIDRLGPGRWIATYPERVVAGFHLTKLFSPTVELVAIVQALNTVDETKRKEAFNQDLALPYTPRGGQLTDEVLDRCRRDYAHGPVKGEPRAVAGIDVGRVLHVVIRGPAHPETGERPQRFAGEVDWDEAGRLMQVFDVRKAVMDALPETAKAREFQQDFRGRVWLTYYGQQRVGSKKAGAIQWNHDEGVVDLDRTRTLDALFAALSDEKLTLPANARAIPDYYAHMKAPIRVLEDGPGGEKVARYVETTDDHFAHAENYCMVAGETTEPASATAVRRDVHAARPRSSWQRG